MKNYSIILFCYLFLSTAQGGQNKSIESQNKTAFYQLVKKGYVRQFKGTDVIPIFSRSKTSCIYNHAPNKISKAIFNSFFNMLRTELNFGGYSYSKTLESCPPSSSNYIYLRNELNFYKSLDKEFSKVFKRHDITTRMNSKINPMAFGGFRIRGDNTVSFSSVNQMTKYIKNGVVREHVIGLITEELFQAITLGRDVDIPTNPMSRLHESKKSVGNLQEVNIPTFMRYKKNNPVGLCGYDLWYLLIISSYQKQLIKYTSFIHKFEQNYKNIKERALLISNNPKYMNLFDPRCSGKNTGINTKIGIE